MYCKISCNFLAVIFSKDLFSDHEILGWVEDDDIFLGNQCKLKYLLKIFKDDLFFKIDL